MDIVIAKTELARLLYVTQSIVERRTTMPILSNVLLSTGDGKLKIAATDLEITAMAEATAEVKSKGSTTVNARVFGDIVRELPEGDIHLKLTEGERLEIVSGGSKLKIIGVSSEEYPSLPGLSFEPKCKVEAREFLEMLQKTIHAVSVDETRFNLNGICFEVAEEKGKKSALRLVATDGHRLALISRSLGDIGIKTPIIVPRKGISEIRRVLEGNESQVGMVIEEGFLVLEGNNTKISVRLIDGEFPDYKQVLPKGKGVELSVSMEALVQALKRVSLLVSDKGKCVRFDLTKNHLKISSSSPELGEAKEDLPVKYEGKDLSIGFNARYILEYCASVTENQELKIDLHGEVGPGKFFVESDESFFGIIMPMRLVGDA